jgi:hypothetical protein
MSLSALAAFAVNNNNSRPTRNTPIYEMSVEDARELVVIRDGNRVAKEDGSQALTLKLGRYAVAMDAVAPKATRINATAEQVEEFTGILKAAIEAGDFDEAIAVVIAEAHPDEQAKRKEKTTGEVPVSDELAAELAEEAPEGVDLDELG